MNCQPVCVRTPLSTRREVELVSPSVTGPELGVSGDDPGAFGSTGYDERYVTEGWGRDYADIPPLRPIIYTDSEHSVIDVSADVASCDSGAFRA